MRVTGTRRASFVAVFVISALVLSSAVAFAEVSLRVDWRSSDDAVSQTVYHVFSGWAGISLQDVLRQSLLFRISLQNSGSAPEKVYIELGFDVNFDNPNYTDIPDAGLRFEEMVIPGGATVTLDASSVDIDVDRLVDDIGQALVEYEEGEDPELPEYLADLTADDFLSGGWPAVAEVYAPPLDEGQLTALGISIVGEVFQTRQLPSGTYKTTVTLHREVSGAWVQVDQTTSESVVKTSADMKVVSPVEGQLVADGMPTFAWSVPRELIGKADIVLEVTVKPVGSSEEVLVGALDLSQVSALGSAKLEYSDSLDPLDAGSYTWTLTAIDRAKSSALGIDRVLFGVPITTGFRVNSAPQVTISDRYVVQGGSGDVILEGDTVTFTGAATDSEDGVIAPASLVWSVDGGRAGTGASLTRRFESAGMYTIELAAVDSVGSEGMDALDIVVSENSPPVIDSFSPESNVEVVEGDVVTFSARASDPDRPGQADITYVWSVEGVDYGFSPQFSFAFVASHGYGASDEPYVVTLTVYDGLGASTSRDAFVIVTERAGAGEVPGTLCGDEDDLIREIIDLTEGGDLGTSLGQELFGFIPSFAGMAIVTDDDSGGESDGGDTGSGEDEDFGDGGGGTAGTDSRTVIYVLSPRDGEIRYATEMIPFVASADVEWALDDPDNVIGRGRHFQRLEPGDHVVYVLQPLSSGKTWTVAEIHVPVESEPESVAAVGMIQVQSADDAVYVGTPSQSAGSSGLYWERPATPGMRLSLMQRVRTEGEASVDIVYDDGFIMCVPLMGNPHIIDPFEAGLLGGDL